MEKGYCLKVNDNLLYFKSLESIKNWFIKNGVKERLLLEDEEYIDLGDLDEIVDDGGKEIYNKEMIERGDDYCVIELDEICWED